MIPTTENQITRLAIPVLKDAGLASKVSSHFGKSRGFIIVDSDGGQCRYIDTKSARVGNECAPIQALVNDGCRALLCRSMGHGALAKSRAAKLHIYQASGGNSVDEVLAAFRAGDSPDLPESALCSHGHDHDHND